MKSNYFWCGLVFFQFSYAGDINFEGFLNSFSSNKQEERRELEKNIEANIDRFRSVQSSKVLFPNRSEDRVSGLWGLSEAKVIPVEVNLKLHKRKRLTENELKGIHNLLNTSLSSANQMVQAIVRDEEGYEWSVDGVGVAEYFKAAEKEHEILDRLKAAWPYGVEWKDVNVSEADSSCKISGRYTEKSADNNSKLRQEIMSAVGNLCSTARLSITPPLAMRASIGHQALVWIERGAFVLLGFSLWGLVFSIRSFRKKRLEQKSREGAELGDDAILLTQIVDGGHDQAAKWMVKAMLSENTQNKEKKDSQIFDQSL